MRFWGSDSSHGTQAIGPCPFQWPCPQKKIKSPQPPAPAAQAEGGGFGGDLFGCVCFFWGGGTPGHHGVPFGFPFLPTTKGGTSSKNERAKPFAKPPHIASPPSPPRSVPTWRCCPPEQRQPILSPPPSRQGVWLKRLRCQSGAWSRTKSNAIPFPPGFFG